LSEEVLLRVLRNYVQGMKESRERMKKNLARFLGVPEEKVEQSRAMRRYKEYIELMEKSLRILENDSGV